MKHKKAPRAEAPGLLTILIRLSCLLDFAVANARRAGTNALRSAIENRSYALEIHVPAAVSHIVGVANLMSKLRALAANITNSCHKPLVYHSRR